MNYEFLARREEMNDNFCCRTFYVIVPRARGRLMLCNRVLVRFKQNVQNFRQ